MKAILVVNLPDGENPEDYEFRYALLVHKQGKYPLYKTALEVRGGNIKPMPQKKDYFDGYYEEAEMLCMQGWNDCLREIEK